MKVNLVRCVLSGGPFHGLRLFFVRPTEIKIGVPAFILRGADGGASHQYEVAGATPPNGLLYAHAGPAETADDEPGEGPEWMPDRFVEAEAPDGTPARKTRVFLDGGPADGAFVILFYPPTLALVDVLFDFASESGSENTHIYERLAGWQEPADLAGDTILFRHAEIEAESSS